MLEGWHTAEDLQAVIGNLGQTGVIELQPQAGDVLGGGVGGVAAIHAGQPLKVVAAPDVAKPVVADVDRRDLAKRRKARQGSECSVIYLLAAYAEAAKARHGRERAKAAAGQIRCLAGP